MTTETDDELYLKLKRWGKMSLGEIQKEYLLPRYVRPGLTEEEVENAWPRVQRKAERPCRRCGGHDRRPCSVHQYLETCVGCGERIGDTPQGI